MARRKPKWSALSAIDRRTRVGTPAWFKAHTAGARRLSAWRRLHMLRPHASIRIAARKLGRKPSSRLHTREMLSVIRQWHG